MSMVGRMAAAGIVAAVLAGCAASAPAAQTSATATTPAAATPSATSPPAGPSPAISPTPGWQAVGDVDGDGRRDRARLVYLGGYGPGNWELIVDMTTLGQQAVRFTGDPVLPGNTAAPTIAGSVDADRDGHADIFVKVSSGASTQFWTIFKLVGRQLRQVTSQGQPVRLAVSGTVTHQDGFRCDGAQFVTVSEATEPPGYTTWTYERDTYAWSGAELVPVSKQTGQVTSAQPASPPAAYSGVSCGDLPQYAPAYTPSTG
ncbi:MAG: FG-GAP repeat domain-containing protein [Streptosporangiaceae bacterium]